MFIGGTLLVGVSLFGSHIIAARDVAAIRGYATVSPARRRRDRARVVRGRVRSHHRDHRSVGPDRRAGWVTAYVLVAALFALGPIEGRVYKKVGDAALRADGNEMTR